MQPKNSEHELEGLLAFANIRQKEVISAVIKCGSVNGAARALGVSHQNVSRMVHTVKQIASTRGYSPEHDYTHTVPDTYIVKGVSTYYDKEGERKGQWVKSTLDRDQFEAMRLAYWGAFAEELPKSPATPPPEDAIKDLLVIYPVGDPHAGMYAYMEETGQAWDLQIYEATNIAAIDAIVSLTPPAETAVYNDKGDSLHVDNNKSRTSRHGHELDTHGRFIEMFKVNLRVKLYHIRKLLEKHKKVIVRVDPGNHDENSALVLSLCLHAHFENEPRVEVDTSPNPYWYYQFGRNMVCTTHGDGPKEADIGKIMAFDQPLMWGATDYKVAIMGHEHHGRSRDQHGVIVHYVPTMAPNDAHHHLKGYRSHRQMKAIKLHREWGFRGLDEITQQYAEYCKK